MSDEEIIEVVSALKVNDKTMKDNGISDNLWGKAVECIMFLQSENAALRARLEKAVELPYTEKCKEYTKIIYKSNHGDIEDETYFHDCFYGENKNIRGDIYTEARLAELKK